MFLLVDVLVFVVMVCRWIYVCISSLSPQDTTFPGMTDPGVITLPGNAERFLMVEAGGSGVPTSRCNY